MKHPFIHNLFWLLLLLAFVAAGVPRVWQGLRDKSIRLVGPNHSVDLYLEMAGGVPNGSERMTHLLTALPEKKPIIVLVNQDDPRSIFLGFMTAYLAWPRDVQLTKLRGNRADETLETADPATFAAVIFCGGVQRPQWIPHGVCFGHWLEIVPVS